MTAAEAVRLPGGDVVVPEALCAALQEALRASERPEIRRLRTLALKAAWDHTERLKGTSGAGTSGVAGETRRRASSDRPAALTTREAAAQLGVTQRNVVDLAARGRLPGSWQDDDGRWWIPAGAVDGRACDERLRTGVGSAAGA